MLDRYVTETRNHHLKIELVIKAGAGTPEWLFQAGAKRLDFVYSNHAGVGKPTKVVIAPPWDETFQTEFASMLARTSAHLKETGALEDVVAIKLTGINIISEELRLPSQTPASTGLSESTDSIAIWESADYRPVKVVRAFARLAASFHAAFPSTTVVLAVIPRNEFPPFDRGGKALSVGRARPIVAEMLNEMVGQSKDYFGGKFILQHDFLIADQSADPATISIARQYSVSVAWQTNLHMGSKGLGAAGYGSPGHGVPLDSNSFERLLDNGIHPAGGSGINAQSRFVEVFPCDAVAFPDVILAAHNKLVRP